MNNKSTTALEIERKYIIEMPDFSLISTNESYTKSEILQTYLTSASGETHRVRKRTTNGIAKYIETRKIRIDEMSSTEIEGEITEEEYLELLKDKRPASTPIEKVRHTFLYLGQLFEIDVYPQWSKTAIMETELSSRESTVKMPSFINIICEVTGNKAYSNSSMSKKFPKESV